ncbi:uncharacterized protein RHO25_004616 [Cercospora beticola]|nr:hypothetical protein RHO25_004616 [Cercospora beticola]
MPGEHMRSGWTNLQPTSLDAYDPHRLTIVTESVKANQYRYCYRGHPDILIPALRQVVLDLPDQCQWYGPVQKQYTPIKGCPIWRRTNPWYKGFCENRHVLTRKFQDAEDEEPDLGDDEEEAIQEMMDDLFAATRPSSDTATPFERLSLAKARIAKLDCGTDEQVQKMVENATSSVDDSDLFEQQLQELTTLLDRIDGIAERSKRLDALLDRADQLKCSLNEDVRTLINSVTNSINDQASCDQHLQSLSALLDKLGGKEQPPGSDPDMLPALRDLRNFVNLGQSCYASASLAMCMNLEKLHDFVMDENNERAKPDSQSGRTPHEWLNTSYPIRRSSTLPGATNPSTTSEDQIAEWSQKHMNNAKNLFGALRNLFTRMNNKGSRISQAEMKAFFDAVHALNPEEFHHNEQNDASVFLIELLQALTLVSDDSIKQKYRDAIASINTADGQNLQPVETDAMTRLTAKLQNGNDSALYILFCVQIATEYYCWSCKLVHRTFEHTPYLELNFIGPTGADQNLVTILQDWSKLSLSEPQKCLHNDSKLGTKTRIRRIVHAPQYLMIKFVRGNYLFMNHVDIPEFLDIRNCTTGVVLPSEIVHGIESAQQVSCIYRLTAVAMFIPTRSHYVAYVVKDRHWLAFDDLSQSPIPVREHPQTAINNGAVPYFTIYEQQPEKTSFPLDLADSVSPGFTLRKNGQVPSPKAALPRWNASDEFECLHLSNPCDKTFRTVGEARGHQHDQVGDDEQAASHL